MVLKADGLAGGKGVLILDSAEEAERALRLFFQERVFGAAGDRVLVEEFLRGQESSFLALFDGEVCVPLPTARDYKKVYDGDRGPNTGGMGAHSPAGVLNAETASQVLRDILWPTFRGLQAEGRGFKGVLYAGLMVTESGPKVLEYNARFGDPETEVILPRVTSDMADVMLATATGGLDGSCRSRSRTRPAWASCSRRTAIPAITSTESPSSDWPTRRGCPESSSSTPARLATATVS